MEMLPVKLEDDELLTRAKRIGEVHEELRIHEERAAEVKRELSKAQLALEAEREKLAAMLFSGKEPRAVKVEAWADFDANEYYQVRKDTGETYERRRLAPEERQGEFDLEGWKENHTEAVVRELAAARRMPRPEGGDAA